MIPWNAKIALECEFSENTNSLTYHKLQIKCTWVMSIVYEICIKDSERNNLKEISPQWFHAYIFTTANFIYFGNLLQTLAQLIYLSTTNIYDHHLYSLKSVTQKGLGLCDFLINRGNARLKFPRHRCTFGALSFSRLECIIWFFFPLQGVRFAKMAGRYQWSKVDLVLKVTTLMAINIFLKSLSVPGCLVLRINEFSFALNPFGGNKDGK